MCSSTPFFQGVRNWLCVDKYPLSILVFSVLGYLVVLRFGNHSIWCAFHNGRLDDEHEYDEVLQDVARCLAGAIYE